MTLNTPTTIEKPQDTASNSAMAKIALPEQPHLFETIDSYAEASLEDRSAPRTKLHIPAILRPSGSTGFHVVVQDLSLSGFCAEAFTGQPVGTRIWITIPGLAPMEAAIARNDGTTIGCAFSNLLNPAIFDNLVARYRVGE